MAKMPIAQSVMNLIEPVLESEGLELVDVEYKKEGSNWFLRVYIDKEGGVNVADCQKVSHLTGDLIEVEETIKTPYSLEVSSPGLNRALKREKDFLKFKGKQIRVQSVLPIDNRKKFIGILADFKDQTVFLEFDEKSIEIPLSQITKANLVIEI
ncbi:MAG: ribosome maturation factor RimP [Nitrospinaceae bacterium]|nr:ribosome maturation factor RimP [Nitrospina sp.]MBT5376851.1 ribosome maturation factor RimP [Nitrospinaceae bacterium]MBT5869314.1 ribosome maturation factor RimP [Nitrospinaceae bacterium]MBT6345646.1 ribosome maturation factor RimP [Nitrospina sp.]